MPTRQSFDGRVPVMEVVLERRQQLVRIDLPLPKTERNSKQWGEYYVQVAPKLPEMFKVAERNGVDFVRPDDEVARAGTKLPDNLAAMVGELVPKSGVTQKAFRRDCAILRAGDDILELDMVDVATLLRDEKNKKGLKCRVNSLQAKILKSVDAAIRGKERGLMQPCPYGCLCLHLWQRPEVEALETRMAMERDLEAAKTRLRLSKDVQSAAAKLTALQCSIEAENVRIATLPKIYLHDDPAGHPDEIINFDNTIPSLKIFDDYIVKQVLTRVIDRVDASFPDPARPVREAVQKFDLNKIIQKSKSHTPKAYVDIVQQWHVRFCARNRKRRQMERVGKGLRAQKMNVQRRFGGRPGATSTEFCRRMLPQLTEHGAPGNLIQQQEYAKFNAKQPIRAAPEPRCGRGALGLFATSYIRKVRNFCICNSTCHFQIEFLIQVYCCADAIFSPRLRHLLPAKASLSAVDHRGTQGFFGDEEDVPHGHVTNLPGPLHQPRRPRFRRAELPFPVNCRQWSRLRRFVARHKEGRAAAHQLWYRLLVGR